MFSFVPLNLIQQFKKASNVYFVVIMMMQMINVISISGGNPAMLPPLAIVVAVSMLKDAYEDYNRHKKDDEENDSVCSTISTSNGVAKATAIKWRDLKVGDVVKLCENEYLPADILVISGTGAEGLCYVETKNLDGETNLKHKVAPKQLYEHFLSLSNARDIKSAEIFCEAPNKDLYKFDGKMKLPTAVSETQESIPLSNDNIMLRGMSLRNTEFVIGIVVYTGSDTKIQMNSSSGKYKTSRIMN